MKKLLFFILLFYSFIMVSISVLANDMTSVSINILSQNKAPVSDVLVQIGDLTAKTNSSGKAEFTLFPAVYDITISKQNYSSTKASIDVSGASQEYTYTLASNFIPVNIKVIDDLTGFPVITSIKATNASTNVSSFSSTNEGGEVVLELDKNSIFVLEVEEKNYSLFTKNLDTSKLVSSNFIFKLERPDAEATFNFNTLEGNVSFRIMPYDTFFKEYKFKGKVLSINIPYGKYEIEIVSNGYKPMNKIVNIDHQICNESFNLVPNNKMFSFYVAAGDESGVKYSDTLKTSAYPVVMKNTTINMFVNNTLEKTIIFDGTEFSTSVPYGVYDIEVKNSLADTFTIENVEFNESTPAKIIFSLKQMFATVSGFVKLGSYFTGGITITFSDNLGNEYSAISDIDGSYSIKVPARSYTVGVSKEGYSIRDRAGLSVNASLPNETYKCDVDIEEIRSIINGKISSLDGSPVPNARVIIKVEKDETVTYSDDNGRYSASINSGLAFIKIDKPGFKSKGNVKTVNKFSTITGVDFVLEEIYASVDGVVTNGISPLENISIKLLDSNKQVVSKTISKANGSFSFSGIKSISDYYISITTDNYTDYISPLIKISYDPVKNYNITLQKNSLTVIYEVKDESNNPLTDFEIKIDGEFCKTDITGFVEKEYRISDMPKNITIQEDKSGFNTTITLDNQIKSPMKKDIIIKTSK